jgi:hypothetical protein
LEKSGFISILAVGTKSFLPLLWSPFNSHSG